MSTLSNRVKIFPGRIPVKLSQKTYPIEWELEEREGKGWIIQSKATLVIDDKKRARKVNDLMLLEGAGYILPRKNIVGPVKIIGLEKQFLMCGMTYSGLNKGWRFKEREYGIFKVFKNKLPERLDMRTKIGQKEFKKYSRGIEYNNPIRLNISDMRKRMEEAQTALSKLSELKNDITHNKLSRRHVEKAEIWHSQNVDRWNEKIQEVRERRKGKKKRSPPDNTWDFGTSSSVSVSLSCSPSCEPDEKEDLK